MLAAGAAAPPPPPPRPSTYREGAVHGPCVADAILGYHNANSLGTPGAGKAYLRDVAARLSDVHAISETSWTDKLKPRYRGSVRSPRCANSCLPRRQPRASRA